MAACNHAHAPMLLFVYGSLRTGGVNDHVVCKVGTLVDSSARVSLCANDLTTDPATGWLTARRQDDSSDAVDGELWRVSDLYVRQVVDPFERSQKLIRIQVQLCKPHGLVESVHAYVFVPPIV